MTSIVAAGAVAVAMHPSNIASCISIPIKYKPSVTMLTVARTAKTRYP